MFKPQTTLVDDYTYISKMDDAVARPEPPGEGADEDARKAFAEAVQEFEHRWGQYLDGAAPPPLKDGIKPTVFHLKHLRLGDTEWLLRNSGSSVAAARLAVKRIDNLDIPGWKLEHNEVDGVRLANLDAMPDYLLVVIGDVGARVIARSRISPK